MYDPLVKLSASTNVCMYYNNYKIKFATYLNVATGYMYIHM